VASSGAARIERLAPVRSLTKTYLEALTDEDLARQLDEPQYQPLPTVAVRLVSVLENAMTNQGQISYYLKAYHRLGGWFPRQAKDPGSVR
jgi:hypothetical protein